MNGNKKKTLYDRVSISVKTLDALIVAGIALIVFFAVVGIFF